MARAGRSTDDYFLCRCCRAELPTSATFCRHCGASEESGWGQDDDEEGLDLPEGYREDDDEFDDDEFDYDEFIAREFPDQAPQGKPSGRRFQLAVVLLLCLGLLVSAVLYVWP
jgi:hypothetical protein